MKENYKIIIKNIITGFIIVCFLYILFRLFTFKKEIFNSNVKVGVATTVKNPHKLNDWIKYHLNINFAKVYIVFDDENENYPINPEYVNNPRVSIFKNTNEWKQEISQLPNMDQFINDTKEVMSRQITNFANVRNYAEQDNIDFLLHIDGDELFYPENVSLEQIFIDDVDSINFQNLEMIPKHDNYENCFIDGVDFKINPGIFNAYSNGKSAVRVNSNAMIGGVHDFVGGRRIKSNLGKILHYPSCNFEEYISKYKILGKFGDKWWNSVQIPFKFHTESRDIITECSARELKGEVNACEHSVRNYYNKSNVYNSNINSSDITTIEFAKNQLLN
jgi:hypothetical protein